MSADRTKSPKDSSNEARLSRPQTQVSSIRAPTESTELMRLKTGEEKGLQRGNTVVIEFYPPAIMDELERAHVT